VSAFKSLTGEKYPAGPLESVLDDVLGTTMLSEALVEVLVTSYEVEQAEPHFFTRHDARNGDDVAMAFAGRATSAAPTYFEPASQGAESARRTFIDGGVFANNPTVCGFAHAMSLGHDEDDMTVVSLGTGAVSRQWAYDEVREWGLANWIRPVLDITAHGANAAIDWQMRSILKDGSYFRLTPGMSDGRTSLDDASEQTVAALSALTRDLIERHDRVFDEIAAAVTRG
jgi:patatin-like phospholipase/acyl hydrolase